MSDQSPVRYLRRVTFLDTAPDELTGPPVHIAQKLLLDGEEHGEVMASGEGWQVFAEGRGGATIVSFVALAEHVTLKTYTGKNPDGGPLLTGTHIAGIPVLTPSDHEWEMLPVMDGSPALVQVFFFVREIEIVAARKPVQVPA